MVTALRLLRAGFHSLLLFLLPWLVGGLAAAFFDVAEVTDTLGRLGGLFLLLVLPVALLQVAGIAVKVRRELKVLATHGQSGFPALVTALDRHVQVLTGRGVGMLFGSLAMVGIALAAKWAQFGVLAVLGLGLTYAAATVATMVSAFSVQGFDERVRRRGGRIDRELSPAVLDAGDPVEERFTLGRLPVPPGFRLQLHEKLPERLGGETRFVAHPRSSRAEATLSAPLPRTPRGEWRLGPATIWYEDVLGLTRVRVASHATASMRVLPPLRPVVVEERPRSLTRVDGPVSALARRPTEDLFLFREYAPGDDTRRVHWKLSVKTGALQVRQPESVPFARKKVRLLLDTYLPRDLAAGSQLLGDLLDLLVEGWVALAQELVRRGEQVTLVVPTPDGVAPFVELVCRRGEERRWRALGAGVAWQPSLRPAEVMAKLAPLPGSAAVLVSGAVAPLEGVRAAELTMIVAEAGELLETPAEDRVSLLSRLLLYRFPVGAEDNRLDLSRLVAGFRRRAVRPRLEQQIVRAAAATSLAAAEAGAAIFRLRRRGTALLLERPR